MKAILLTTGGMDERMTDDVSVTVTQTRGHDQFILAELRLRLVRSDR